MISKRVNHPNILSIEGVAPKLLQSRTASQWMQGGNMLGYMKNHPEANRLELVNLTRWQSDPPLTGSQLLGTICGLGYLHKNEVVHGDLKSVREIHPAIFPG